MSEPTVLYDVPGPRARLRNNIYTLLFAVVVLGVLYFLIAALNGKGQWRGVLWEPFTRAEVWTGQILPGLVGTLKAAALAVVLALAFGVIFGLARLSDHAWIRVPAGTVVEFARAIPLLITIFFIQTGSFALFGVTATAFTALVVGLTLYNGSVLAEIFRAGIRAVPRGQSEAAYSLGLNKTGVTRLILLPQAVTAMMPAIVAQLVVLLKDTALGWIVAYEDLLNAGLRLIPANFSNVIPAAIVITVIYIVINMALSELARRLEQRNRRRRRIAAVTPTMPGAPTSVEPGMGGQVVV